MGSVRYRPSVVDIFCGCGGLSEGFEQAGYGVLLGIDCNKYAVDTYNRNHGHTGRVMNVEDVDSDYIFSETGRNEIDVLAGTTQVPLIRRLLCLCIRPL
jgi:DNA (cytosine-5)-methyltransferase 1